MRRERVQTYLRDGVLDIALGDAVMTARQCAELVDLLGEYAEDRELRAVVLRSESADFCVGIDDELIMQRSYSATPADLLAGLRVPVVAVLNGRVESAGLELALAADVRLATPDARFRLSEVSQGRLPCWGGTQRLPRVIGQAAALRMILFGEPVVASDALHQGLVHEVVDTPLGRAAEYTAEWLTRAPLALEYAKEAVRDGSELRLREGLALEADLNTLLQTSRDRAEGIAAFLGKRAASFRNA
ncbi:enoyl-CoA hydratase/isomerase family protein [Gryllotalpicola sp.]|uniref:enoyl-CoA hydratase/isomerase family protein n=1 Tax=Gryllotalpicola sp. TaxID=1932787 RepID=UPI0026178DBA|nr:enoyl-CoA hydratase/isomerase family protein [Gryllotalpicola sp.]